MSDELQPVVEELCREVADVGWPESGRIALPSRAAVFEAVEALRTAFFPGFFGEANLQHGHSLNFYVGSAVDGALETLRDQIRRGLAFAERHDFERCAHCGTRAQEVVRTFLGRLPAVRRLVATDVDAAYAGDPALRSRDEAIFSYPGIYAVTSQRLAHELHVLQVPLIPRLITEHAHSATGIDIHPGATIGPRFFIDHGTGTVIGETARIGSGVRLYQGVTLGAKSFQMDEHGQLVKGIDRHPIVEDDVVIYAGATILGRITIGRGSIIGGNVWVTESVAPGSRVTQAMAHEARFDQGGGI